MNKSLAQKRACRHEMKRMQEYVGLRNADNNAADISASSSSAATPGPSQNHWNQVASVCGSLPLLVSIDIEAFEFDQNRITEIGMSTLDCRHVAGVSPGPRGGDWMTMIRARHFRVSEYRHLVNSKFIQGCPENFLFGKSEWISRGVLVQFLTQYFNALLGTSPETPAGTRKVVLVGHSVQSDIKYLKSLGFDPAPVIADCIDTINLMWVVNRNVRHIGLGKLLTHFNLPSEYLHNAGNDAYYTLQVALVIALDFVNRPSAAEWEAVQKERTDQAIKDAVARVLQELEGWSSTDEEEQDAADDWEGDAELPAETHDSYMSGTADEITRPHSSMARGEHARQQDAPASMSNNPGPRNQPSFHSHSRGLGEHQNRSNASSARNRKRGRSIQ